MLLTLFKNIDVIIEMNFFHPFSFVFILLFSSLLWAQETVRMSCVTNPPTTSYQIIEGQEHYHLTIYHHNGVGYLPLHSGVITPNDLPLLEKRGQILKKMGPQNRIPFLKSDCKNQNGYWRCQKKGETQLNDLTVSNIYFSMASKHVTYDESYSWQTIETHLFLQVGKENLIMNYPFNREDCQIQVSKISHEKEFSK